MKNRAKPLKKNYLKEMGVLTSEGFVFLWSKTKTGDHDLQLTPAEAKWLAARLIEAAEKTKVDQQAGR